MKKKMIFTVLMAGLLAFSCSDDNDGPSTANLVLNLNGLEELGSDYLYEGWLIVDGAPVSTGKFSSVTFPQNFVVNASQLEKATTFALTIEPVNDPDSGPSETKILIGDFSGNTASVSSKGVVADFNSATGKYILATPTDDDPTNEESGIWFLDISSGMPTAGLSLPTLDNGWKYEGWVVIDGKAISTGTFTSVNAPDDNAATSPFKGNANNGPGYPGEDFLQNAPDGVTFPTDLKGKLTVITVEPNPDNSPMPFTFKPLAHTVPNDAMNFTTINMGTGPLLELTGTVTR